MNVMQKYICVVIFAVTGFLVSAQSFSFKSFDSDKGLPQNFVYCLAQDHQGYLWIGTGEGLVRYDGIHFKVFTQKDSLSADFIHSLFVDKYGILWVGHNNGTLSYYQNGFHKVNLKDKVSSPIRDFCQDEIGNVWAVVQNYGIIRIDTEKNITTHFKSDFLRDKLFYSIESVTPYNLLLGTSEGLTSVLLNQNFEVQKVHELDGVPPTTINAIVKRRLLDGQYWIATEDEGIFLYQQQKNITSGLGNNKLCVKFNLHNENILDIYEEENGNLLLATWGNGVIKLFFDPTIQQFNESFNFSTENGLNHNFIKCILADNENNYWFATYGGGVSALLNESFVHYHLDEIGFKQNKALAVMAMENNLWIGLENGILHTDPYCFANHEFYDEALGIPIDRIAAFESDKNGTLWIATRNNGLYYRSKGKLGFQRFDYTGSIIGNKINDLAVTDDQIFLATAWGLFIINNVTKEIEHFTTLRGLPHNSINFVYVDEEGKVWLGPKSSGICSIDSANIEIHKLSHAPIDVSGMTKDQDGNWWLSTIGKGILKYDHDTLISIGITEGLTKNYCYDIVCDKNNQLWVCHWPGLSSVDLNTMKIRKFGFEEQMGGDFYQIWEDKTKHLWFASSNGIVKYFPEKDKLNTIAPKLNFTQVTVSGKDYAFDKKIDLPYPYKQRRYNFRFDFTGISFKNPLGVTYEYKMEKQGDEETSEWIPLGTTSYKEFEFLPDGKFTFSVRAFNSDGTGNKSPISLQIQIQSPLWKKVWFYILVIITLVLFIYWLIKFRERKIQRQKEALQREVDSQTIILREQKAEIERKNNDITASINYAKRIQKSILPQIEVLKKSFPDSFVYFKPRDIVSGDFYWFNRNRNVFTLCCADCTGHGVPGAFMSMIGTTLLNDIYRIDGIVSPAEILERLDSDIRTLLQKDENSFAKDGMDISVIEINLNSGKIRLASAKRPVYLFINKELAVYNGARRSIGDNDFPQQARFVNYEYSYNKGDAIYVFSDGYTDQFGGPKGKKMMKVGVKNLLEEIYHKPMGKQEELIENYFVNWKGDLDQIDDVLFIGIRL
jgi:ligand-binding sensor domain-containing protein